MDKARVYQTYLAEKQHGRGVFARVGRAYGKSDEWARKIVRDYEQSAPAQASVIKAFSPQDLRYIPAPLEVEYQAERDRLAKDLAACQQNDLLCQLLSEDANCQDSASYSDSWQPGANWQYATCQQVERITHCCEYMPTAKFYSCAVCFGPGLGWSVAIGWAVIAAQLLFISAAYRLHGAQATPLLTLFGIVLAAWTAFVMMLSAAWLDTVFVAWRLWLAAFGLIMFVLCSIAIGL